MASSDKEISYSNLKDLLAKGSGLLVDVRTKDEVDRGHIPGSIHIPGRREDGQIMENVESDMSLEAAEFQSKFGVVKPSLDSSELVFHCQMGRRGALATEKARNLGFKNACNYAGGYKEWSEKGGK
ncbi:thiosulfate sulfurtransferase/rhodanese-like domain-containing protein 1 isoform X1 [Sinocyclocheilus anshuiensis]|uniref:thiosulfate sulfurtransferase/rhodanese-like domain-containing protein 1 isoform X1 n=1 Tax=Sinocyclocheilus anshuiensis TaxID=1608454 RepID=UPI0007B8458D|nr:PREDICTED: thiosulfate sulfurtransferase/rhodanese-like domain-containing protein 1 isoform X1 [Sinocyclocheilus anshuiensis]